MFIVAVLTLVFTVATGVVVALGLVVARITRGPLPSGWLRRQLVLHGLLLLVHLFATVPLAMGYLGSRMIGTRGDEQGWQGPRFRPDGTWVIQTRDTLRAEASGQRTVDPEDAARAEKLRVRLTSLDGIPLNGWLVPPKVGVPVATVLLVHGLFRSSLELETVAAMFRRRQCEVLLLDLRCHGDSGRAPFTFGLRESKDVRAAAAFLRGREGSGGRPLVLFAVSLGTSAVALALPHIEDIGGVVLDAPMDDLLLTAHRMLGSGAGEGRRRLTLWEPWRSLALSSIGLWSSLRPEEVRPVDALWSVPAEVPVLLIGAGADQRMPPDAVRRVFDGLPQPDALRQLWVVEGARHGRVWDADPRGYEQHIGWLLDRILERH